MNCNKLIFTFLSVILIYWSCSNISTTNTQPNYLESSHNVLDFRITPKTKFDNSGNMFSDQGAWFAYSLSSPTSNQLGFSGPFLMTQQNGVWLSAVFTNLQVRIDGKDLSFSLVKQESFSSHLIQVYKSNFIELWQKLVFKNGSTVLLETKIVNTSNKPTELSITWNNTPILADGISLSSHKNLLQISSLNSKANGYVLFPTGTSIFQKNNLNYEAKISYTLPSKSQQKLTISQSFIFPEYSWQQEKCEITSVNFDTVLKRRKKEKNFELKTLIEERKPLFKGPEHSRLLAKAHLTLQNNWRISAGEIKHEGLFPSYHYKGFHGFWSWDSWKHAVGISNYNTDLATNQINLMFDFQLQNGFIPDCVFRDTLIENHNFRDTKPPLSAWSVLKTYEKSKNLNWLKKLYPKLKKYHNWWYLNRDHDKDGLCEYGSTDGSIIAAKWESGMDNAIRYDNSLLLKNGKDAYSFNQESVDLNCYLYAEKRFLAKLASVLKFSQDSIIFSKESEKLKTKIQQQFFNATEGWFFDTDITGKEFIKGKGSEGWTALWANVATDQQAKEVKNTMMNPTTFFTKVPFQTISADHHKFDPLNGYWRGPNWLDQAYFGVKGLRNYGFNKEADKAAMQILKGADGLFENGKSIRENYHPITGVGLHAHNFSWSAAHIIMLLTQ